MCDRCRAIKGRIEEAVTGIEQEFQGTMEHHIAQVLRDDPMANAAELRKAFTSVGPNFHVAMQLGKVAAEKSLEAHNGDTIAAYAASTEHVSRAVSERHKLLHMETPSGSSQTRPM